MRLLSPRACYVRIDIMSISTYSATASVARGTEQEPQVRPEVQLSKELVVFAGIKTPPMGRDARRRAGFLLRLLQEGEKLEMPHSKPMPRVGRACHELRIPDDERTWRIMYHVGTTEIVVLEVFKKKTSSTEKATIELCRARLKAYLAVR